MSRGPGPNRRRGALLRLGDPLFRSPRATRRLFGVDPGPLDHDAFDFATLALRRTLPALLQPGQPVIEVGTGPDAVLAAWLHQRGHRVTAWERDPPSAARAQALLRTAFGTAAPTVHAAAFGPDSPVDGALVLANPPYVPRSRGQRLGLDPARPHAWDGGHDGLDGYRDLVRALAGRFDGVVVVGGSWFFHRPGRVARALELRDAAWCSLGPGWALSARL